jgi:UDP-2,3-diacylglucosamine pyrophosphatase LpxH
VKRIKLVISDLHLGVGKTLKGGGTNPLEEFYYDERFSEFLNYYTSGEYTDAHVELILNGDILNFLQIDYRGHFLSVFTEDICVEKLRRIVEGHPIFFEALRAFVKDPKHTVTYVVGNHDQSMLWPGTRDVLNEAIGAPVRFKNIVYFFDGVHIEHGHMHEAANRIDPKKFFLKKDVAEPILNLPLGSHFFVDFVLRVKQRNPYIDKVRPFKAWVIWALLFHTRFAVKTLSELFWYFLSRARGKESKKNWTLASILRILAERAIFPDLGAAAKQILDDERVHTVIFGHNHVYQYRQWGVDKEYFNTGTWTELTSLDMPSLGKITKLTYVLLDYPSAEGPRPRGRLKEWRGYHRIEEDVDVS